MVVCCRCVLHRPCSTTCMHPCIKPLGIHARRPCRAECVAAALTPLGATPQTPFLTTIEVFQQPDSLRFLRRLFFYSPNDILHFYRKNFNTKSKFSVGGILNCLNRYNTAIFVLLSLIIKITETRAEIASAIGNTHHISISGTPLRTSIENPHATGSTSTS